MLIGYIIISCMNFRMNNQNNANVSKKDKAAPRADHCRGRARTRKPQTTKPEKLEIAALKIGRNPVKVYRS